MPSATSSNLHIPAWKRLGLKLKSPTNNAEPESATEQPTQVDLRKRKRLNPETSGSRKSKKISSASEFTNQDPITPTLSRKKSVTFTPETKVEDGDSIKQLFNSWAADQKAQDPTWQLKTSNPAFKTPIPTQVEEQIDTTLDEKERRVKRIKKLKPDPISKSAKKSETVKNTVSIPRPFLQYLKQYHESRETWKFNKNHQSHLLKHIFDVDIIPSDYAHLIYPYVRGLQGLVRTRLRDEALAIKIKDLEDGIAGFPKDMANPERRQAEYEASMKDYIATRTVNDPELSLQESGFEEGVLMGLSDVAMQHRVAKRIRAENILDELASSSDNSQAGIADSIAESGADLKRLRMNDGSAQKVPRKRKQRTATTEESSSSDSSSDSSDSSSEEDETTENNDRTSDSSSSSSSSSDGSSGTGSSGSDDESSSGSSSGSNSEDESESESH